MLNLTFTKRRKSTSGVPVSHIRFWKFGIFALYLIDSQEV